MMGTATTAATATTVTTATTAEIGTRRERRPAITGRELLALQLLARRYSLEQIAHMRQDGLIETLWDLQRVLDFFKVTTVSDAIEAARRRGMIT